MISFYNTLTRKTEQFIPLKAGEVRMYTCGPTVYNYAHIGNLRAYTFEDLLRRYLKFRGFKVKQVMNITDVDDKIIKACRGNAVSLTDYTEKFTRAFFRDLELLNIEKAEVYPRATRHIPEMVELIQNLLAKGIAYRGEDGSIYYSIAKFPDYGKLSHLDLSGLKAGARVKQDEYGKESFSDFALWKAWDENDGQIFWETPLGKGRPGWHIECSAMSMKYLGETFDIHTGGVDNIFPHHENEIAQSEAATGKPFVRYWLHCEHLLVDSRKMAKSLGNFYTLNDIIKKGFSPLSLRWFFISSHYRSKLNFTFSALETAERTVRGLYDFIQRLEELPEGEETPRVPSVLAESRAGFISMMDEDLNSSTAVAHIFRLVNQCNIWMKQGLLSRQDAGKIKRFLFEIDRVLGLDLESAQNPPELTTQEKARLKEREIARKNRDFKKADLIRNEFLKKGYLLKDTPLGTRVKKK